MITKSIEIEVEITPEELAQSFCNCDDTEQVYFFNEVARLMNNWEKPYAFQLSWITENEKLTKQARSLLQELGEYAEVNHD